MAERLIEPGGSLDEDDVENSPVERGEDPLGDQPRSVQRRGQFIMACILGVLFAILAVSDMTSGHVGRGLLAAVIAVLNAVIAVREQAKPRR